MAESSEDSTHSSTNDTSSESFDVGMVQTWGIFQSNLFEQFQQLIIPMDKIVLRIEFG